MKITFLTKNFRDCNAISGKYLILKEKFKSFLFENEKLKRDRVSNSENISNWNRLISQLLRKSNVVPATHQTSLDYDMISLW